MVRYQTLLLCRVIEIIRTTQRLASWCSTFLIISSLSLLCQIAFSVNLRASTSRPFSEPMQKEKESKRGRDRSARTQTLLNHLAARARGCVSHALCKFPRGFALRQQSRANSTTNSSRYAKRRKEGPRLISGDKVDRKISPRLFVPRCAASPTSAPVPSSRGPRADRRIRRCGGVNS